MADLDAATLRRMYVDEQMTVAAIARALQVRKQTVCDALARWDIPRRRHGLRRQVPELAFTPGELRRLVDRKGIHSVARRLRVAPDVVYAYLQREPLPRGTKRMVDDAAVWAAYQAGMTIAQLVAEFRGTRHTIKRSLRRSFLRTVAESQEPKGV